MDHLCTQEGRISKIEAQTESSAKLLEKMDKKADLTNEKLDNLAVQFAVYCDREKNRKEGFGTVTLLASNFMSALVVGIIVKVF